MSLLTIGKHWSADKIANTFSPTKKTADKVAGWLEESGIDATRRTYSTGKSQATNQAGFKCGRVFLDFLY
jgi:hypothetical protein